MAKDFLGNDLFVGDQVVVLVHRQTSSWYAIGSVVKLTEHTAMVLVEGKRERRFDHRKLIKITESGGSVNGSNEHQ